MRTLTCIATLSAALLMAHSAFAETTVAKACRTDIKKQCGDEMKSGGAALKDCMKTHFSDLSEDCQVAIVRTASVGKACKADEKKLCADVKPGKDDWRVHEIACGRPQRRLQRGAGQIQREVGDSGFAAALRSLRLTSGSGALRPSARTHSLGRHR